jgi:glycosyltransferase involved in cell wall biosynthesis
MDIYPKFHRQFPAARLRVYSSLAVYQKTETKNEEWLLELYQQCKSTEGVEYIGSLPQPELAKALRSISILAYPNTFSETSCISVMEAMATGCLVITSEFGALPETVNRFSQLIPVYFRSVQEFSDDYYRALWAVYTEFLMHPEEMYQHLWEEVLFTNTHYTWSVRAREWTEAFETRLALRN